MIYLCWLFFKQISEIKPNLIFSFKVMKFKLLLLSFLLAAAHGWSQKSYTLVTSAADLEVGKNYLVSNRNTAGAGFALGYQNTNNRPQAAITVVNNAGVMTITTTPATLNTETTSAFEITIATGSVGKYTLFDAVNSTYLIPSPTTNNQLKGQATASDWTISIGASAVITNTGHPSSDGRNIIRYNSTNSLFACYASGQAAVYLYKEIPVTKSVIYNGNTNTGGSVPVDGTAYNSGNTVTVLGNSGTLTKTGFAFNGWNTLANGSGTHYNPGDTFTITNNVTLYAEWVSTTPPTITSTLTASGAQGSPFSYTITATQTPTSYNATGLPAGLSINTTTGVISGTPTLAWTYNVTISATNGSGTDTQTLVITVSAGACFTEDFASASTGNSTVSTGSNTVWAGNANFPTLTNAYQAAVLLKLEQEVIRDLLSLRLWLL